MMNKETRNALLLDYVLGKTTEEQNVEIKKMLAENPEFAAEEGQLRETMETLSEEETPQVSGQMDDRFYDFLNEAIEKQGEKSNGSNWWNSFLDMISPQQVKVQWVMGVLLLAAGLVIGYQLKGDGNVSENAVEIAKESNEVRQDLVLTLLEQPSATKRLQGISEASKFEDPEKRVVEALLKTLNNDPNVNVRLAAIESLANLTHRDDVREGLVTSIVHQDSALIQVTLADLMVAMQEKRSVSHLQQLIQTKRLEASAKKKIEESIQSLI